MMMALLDTNEDLDACAIELGGDVGQLLTPLTRRVLQKPTAPWAIDNGAFSGFVETRFMGLLERNAHHRDNCLFVVVPDVVGSARRTLEVFERWAPRLSRLVRLALACQRRPGGSAAAVGIDRRGVYRRFDQVQNLD